MSFRASVVAAICSAALVGPLGCSNPDVTAPGGLAPALTALPRDLSPAERGVLAASNGFSLALWKRINATQRDSNVFVSPLSASFALGMTLNGAAGQTFDEMRSALKFGSQPLADIDAGYKSLIALLTSLDPSTTMTIGNSIWYDRAYTFNQSFLNDGATYFNAEIKPLDFRDVGGSLGAINGWVNTQTKGKIPTILQSIDPGEVMFLINAIYFKGSWRERFDPALTSTAAFHSVAGDQSARLMHRVGRMGYASSPTYQAVDLPYGDSAFTMTVIVPAAGTSVETVAASLDDQTWQSLVSSLRTGLVDLYLPRVTMTWQRDLIPDLEALGMHVPFTSAADFTRMSSLGRQLYISLVKQKTFVDINEEGTEAAAVTAVGVALTSAPVANVVRADRPFIFVIRERLSGTVLFMGKVVRLP
jgi:serpin B